jgi:hypothetical protein
MGYIEDSFVPGESYSDISLQSRLQLSYLFSLKATYIDSEDHTIEELPRNLIPMISGSRREIFKLAYLELMPYLLDFNQESPRKERMVLNHFSDPVDISKLLFRLDRFGIANVLRKGKNQEIAKALQSTADLYVYSSC